MGYRVRFGPAGRPLSYKGPTDKVGDYLRDQGLQAYEYQATYGVRVTKQSALNLKKNLKKNNILPSLHAPYYINLAAKKKDVLARSIQRLVQSARAADWMKAYRIVFHPGFYTEYNKKEAMERCHKSIGILTQQLDTFGVDYIFAPETTGKKSQLGSLDEIIEICQEHDKFVPTIDFAHLYARSGGKIVYKEDYSRIFQLLEDELSLNTLHSHFTRIEFTDKGERRHHILAQDNFGPPLEPLLEEIIERGWNVTIISETPFLDEDALLMQKTYHQLLGKYNKNFK